MIESDMTRDTVLMPQDVAMKFMIWAGYCHGLTLEKGKSFGRFGRFSGDDVFRLDGLQEVLFRTFDSPSVESAMKCIMEAKANGEPCPFSVKSLDELFATPLKV